MSEEKGLMIILLIAFLFAIIYLIYKAIKDDIENKKIEEEYKLYEKRQEEKEIKRKQEYSIKWNKEIQAKFNGKIKYKTNMPIKVLIGDYTNSMAPITNSLLRSMGIETEVVPSASDIIDRISNGNKYDVIITNNVYPQGESGEMVLKRLKNKSNFDIPIIILTVDQNARNIYLDKGFDEYIAKPIDEEKTIEILPRVIPNLKFKKIQNKSNKS